MMSPSSVSSANTITEVNWSMFNSSKCRRCAVFPTWCTSFMFRKVSTSKPPSASNRSRSESATEAMMWISLPPTHIASSNNKTSRKSRRHPANRINSRSDTMKKKVSVGVWAIAEAERGDWERPAPVSLPLIQGTRPGFGTCFVFGRYVSLS